MVIGIYRAPSEEAMSVLPFVYLSPRSECEMQQDDKIYVFANPYTLQKCLVVLDLPLIPGSKEGTWFLGNIAT